MNLFDDHERYVRKNATLASGYNTNKSDRKFEDKGVDHLKQGDASCFNCKHKKKCVTFDKLRTGGSTGAVSFGGDEKFICDRYELLKSDRGGMNDKQIKSMLKNAKKGLF